MRPSFSKDALCHIALLPCYMFDPASKPEFSAISKLIASHLLEPYSIFTYWYFLHTWPQYCYTLKDNAGVIVAVIVAKAEPHRAVRMRGYIAMLTVDPHYRHRGIALLLVRLAIRNMREWDLIDEVMLETEENNLSAINLYESLGFVRTKRMYRYYLNTHDAYRYILPLTEKLGLRSRFLGDASAKAPEILLESQIV